MARAVSAKDGSILQQERLGDLANLYSSPISDGDTSVVFTRRSGAYTLRAKDLSVIHHNDLDDDSVINASPAVTSRPRANSNPMAAAPIRPPTLKAAWKDDMIDVPQARWIAAA